MLKEYEYGIFNDELMRWFGHMEPIANEPKWILFGENVNQIQRFYFNNS
jgi:hypothetical protein